MTLQTLAGIKAIIGLGNPGKRFSYTRHNIGFMVVDKLVDNCGGSFSTQGDMEVARITINDKPYVVIKPQTFMNDSGRVIPFLKKQGIQAQEMLVVHDELEKKFGAVGIKIGGSARGHNGLRSIIAHGGEQCAKLWCGIGRPEQKEQVADYVLENFSEQRSDVEQFVDDACQLIIKSL
jgi:PTH1 family peptidyl-tRNA hydrolase